MSRFHPSWPSPLLALDPIRLRPMGWLDDLLPMRPPSLWRDRSLYARALRWQPDMADLSWLFDAYAMLGIEMPPPRIEHRTHQRSPQRGRLKGNARHTQLRRRRAPIKGAGRPLAIPTWSSPPQMVAPARTETRDRVDNAPSFRSRKIVGPQNLAKVAWRSPERTAPTPTLARATGTQVTPSLGVQPTLLRKTSLSEESSQQDQIETQVSDRTQSGGRQIVKSSERVVPKSQRQPEVLAPRKPKVQPFPAIDFTVSRREGVPSSEHQTPPPKVTWQQGHVRSPWRLNQTGRTLFKPQAGPSQRPHVPEMGTQNNLSVQTETIQPVQKRLSEKIIRLGRTIQTRTDTVSEDVTDRSFRFRPVVEQVEWRPVRKGLIRDVVQEQGVFRTVTPTVQMELPPSPRREPEASPVSKNSTSDRTETSVSPSVNRTVSSPSVEPLPKTKVDVSVEPVLFQAGRARVQRQTTPRVRRTLVETTKPQFQKSSSPSMVQVPNRVPWRLKPSIPSERTRVPQRIEPDESVNSVSKRSATPVAQQTFTPKRRRIPQVESWFRPQRQRLIEHFQQRRANRFVEHRAVEVEMNRSGQRERSIDSVPSVKKRLESGGFPSLVAPSYNFASTGSATQSVFRVQDQTMVAPLRAGTLVFPTPVPSAKVPKKSENIDDSFGVSENNVKRRDTPSEQLEDRKSTKHRLELSSEQQGSKELDTASSPVSKAGSVTQKVEVQSQEKPDKKQYPEPFVQTRSVYQRRSLRTSTAFWTLPKRGLLGRNTSPVTSLIQDKSIQREWRLPYVPFSSAETEGRSSSKRSWRSTSTTLTTNSVFRVPSTFWQGSFVQGHGRGNIQLQSPMVYTTLSPEIESGSRRVESAKTTGPSRSRVVTRPTSKSDLRWIPKQVVDANASSVQSNRTTPSRVTSEKKRTSPQQRRVVPSVSWRRKPTFPDPFLAQRQSITLQLGNEHTSPTIRMSTSASDSTPSQHSSDASQMAPVVERKNAVSEVEWVQSTREKNSVDTTQFNKSKGNFQAPQSGLTAVRRVVAPTLSAAIVYNSTSVSQSIQQDQVSIGKYSQSSYQAEDRRSTSVKSPSTKLKSIGKYGPKSSDDSSHIPSTDINIPEALSPSVSARNSLPPSRQKSVGKYPVTETDAAIGRGQTNQSIEDVQESIQDRMEESSLSLQESVANNVNIDFVAEQTVRKAVRRLVRRLPSNQQALLRSRISLPTNWARKLGLAPNAEVKLGWRLQQRVDSALPLSGTVATPSMPFSRQQFVIPSVDRSDEFSETSRVQQRDPENVSKRNVTPKSRSDVSQSSTLRLSNTQINRIIERQVSFFRSVQRQSFLKADQMTERASSASVPAPARVGLQQVTGEMRKALQRMVFSSESQPVFLDSIPDIDAVIDRPLQSKREKSSTASQVVSKKQTIKRSTRLGVRTPQWRPGVHTPSLLGKSGLRTSPQRRRSDAGIDSVQNSVSSSVPVSRPSIVPNTTSMTMLQADETSQLSDRLASTNSSDVNTTAQPVNRSQREQITVSKRKNISRGRSSTVAPLSLIGKSNVGVFLQPKRKGTEPEDIPSNPPQSEESVSTDSDVFMIDATGNLLTGETAKKRLKELGFARSKSTNTKNTSATSTSDGSYTWEAPADMMKEAVKQVRKEMGVQEKVKESPSSASRPVRQSVIKEWTEEQLLTILVELASSSPEANALLRDVQERVEEYFDLERFRKI